jgi:hypothetical protein
MKRAAVLSSLIVASTAGAQGTFEGTVTYQMANNETMQYTAKGNKARMDMASTQMPGAAMIFDRDSHVSTMIIPQQKMYMTMPMGQAEAHLADTARGKVTKVGSEVVAGIPCDDYQATANNGEKQGTICLAHGMGNFLWYGSSSPFMRQMESRVSGLSSALANGGFPLKIVKSDGQTTMLATKVEKKPVDASAFAPPAGYTQMQMPAGMAPH